MAESRSHDAMLMLFPPRHPLCLRREPDAKTNRSTSSAAAQRSAGPQAARKRVAHDLQRGEACSARRGHALSRAQQCARRVALPRPTDARACARPQMTRGAQRA